MAQLGSPLLFNQTGNPMSGIPLQAADAIGMFGGGLGFFHHFFTWEGGLTDADDMVAGWEIKAPQGTPAVTHHPDANTGVLRLETGATLNDNVQLERRGTFKYVSGKKLFCFMRLAIEDADDQKIVVGLAQAGAADYGSGGTHGIFFTKSETNAHYDFLVRDASVSSTISDPFAATSDLADDTMHVVGFVVNTDGTITPYLTTDQTGTWTPGSSSVANDDGNLPNDATDSMSWFIFNQNGAATADHVDLDWVCVWQEV